MHDKAWHVARPAEQCWPLANAVKLTQVQIVAAVTGRKLHKFLQQGPGVDPYGTGGMSPNLYEGGRPY